MPLTTDGRTEKHSWFRGALADKLKADSAAYYGPCDSYGTPGCSPRASVTKPSSSDQQTSNVPTVDAPRADDAAMGSSPMRHNTGGVRGQMSMSSGQALFLLAVTAVITYAFYCGFCGGNYSARLKREVEEAASSKAMEEGPKVAAAFVNSADRGEPNWHAAIGPELVEIVQRQGYISEYNLEPELRHEMQKYGFAAGRHARNRFVQRELDPSLKTLFDGTHSSKEIYAATSDGFEEVQRNDIIEFLKHDAKHGSTVERMYRSFKIEAGEIDDLEHAKPSSTSERTYLRRKKSLREKAKSPEWSIYKDSSVMPAKGPARTFRCDYPLNLFTAV